MAPRWQPDPDIAAHAEATRYQHDVLIDDAGEEIATLTVFDYGAYPWAKDPATGEWARGGAFRDGVAAMHWAERFAGVHPRKPGDSR